MEQISFKDWRLIASVVDTDVLKLDIEAVDGSDIIEVGHAGPAGRDEQYTLRLSTQNLEEAHSRTRRRTVDADGNESEIESDEDEDETIYTRGWEVTALVDEEGMLNVLVERGEGAEIYELEPVESGVPLSSRLIVRLAAEEEAEEDEDEEEEEDDLEDEYDELEDLDEYDEYEEYEDDYDDELEEDEEYSRYRGFGGRRDELY